MTTTHDRLDDAARARVARAAATLIAARNDRTPLEPFGPDTAPRSIAEACAVDDLVAATSGWAQRGWKVGCTSEHAQKLLGVDHPFSGRVYTLFESEATLGDDDLMTEPSLEGEFAFTIAADIEPRADAYDRDEVARRIADVRPAIEIVGGRFATFIGGAVLDIAADAGANTCLVLGPGVTVDDPTTLATATAEMTVDGERTGGGTGADVLGGPLEALTWLVNHLSERGITLQAGEVVTTGTATQVSPLPRGSTATVTLGGVGSATVSRR